MNMRKNWLDNLRWFTVLLVIAAVGLALKQHSSLPPYAMYLLLTLAVFTLSPLLYELIRRIPVIRWCVLGIRKR